MRVLIVTNMYPIPEEPSFGTFIKSQVDSLKQAGIQLDVLLINGRKSQLNYLWGIFRFWRQLWGGQYDVIHAHYIFSGMIARLQWNRPVVLTHHGIEVTEIGWVSTLVRLTHKWFSRVIVVSPAQIEFLQDSAVALIPCGVDLTEMQPIPVEEARHRLGLPLDKKLVLWAGEHWRPEKRFELVEPSMILLKKQIPEAELVLLSGQPHSAVPIYMSACDVLLLSSLYEGSPMVIKEAMACNLPIVSTDVGDVAQVIDGTEGCYLCSSDPADMAEKLTQALVRGQRTKGRQKIHHFGSELTAKKIIGIYNQVCPPEKRFSLVT